MPTEAPKTTAANVIETPESVKVRRAGRGPGSPFYETRRTDYFYRDDRGGRSHLACAPHLHRHVELAYLTAGRARGYADAACCDIEPGDLFVAFPNQVHRFESDGSERYMLFIVNPDIVPELSERLVTAIPESNLIRAAELPPQLPLLMRAMALSSAKAGKSSGEVDEQILHGYLLAFFGELLRCMRMSAPDAGDTQTMRAVIDYCARNYTQPLTLSVLSEQLHISKYYISHLFSSKLRVRFNDYVNSLRVAAACRYLRQGELSVTEISEAVGFSTLRTFNRAFMRHMGCPPSEYRRTNAAEGAASLPV